MTLDIFPHSPESKNMKEIMLKTLGSRNHNLSPSQTKSGFLDKLAIKVSRWVDIDFQILSPSSYTFLPQQDQENGRGEIKTN